jgi:four helix bundle protein
MKVTRFEDLDCGKESRVLVQDVYEATRKKDFSKDLRFSGQIQAAAISVMANIAEGFIRRSDKEFIQFLYIAMSSSAEVRNHLYVALDLEYIDKIRFEAIYDRADKVGRMISNLIKYLRGLQVKPSK